MQNFNVVKIDSQEKGNFTKNISETPSSEAYY